MKHPTKAPASYAPWHCVICAVDPGEHAGVSVWVSGKLEHHAKITHPNDVIGMAWMIAEHRHLPLVFVIEKHSPYGKWSHNTKEGMGRYVGRWLDAIEQLPKRRPTTKVLRVLPQTWRAKVFSGIGPHCTTARWKQLALLLANEYRTKGSPMIESPDEAESLLIGKFACYWPEVGKLPGIKA